MGKNNPVVSVLMTAFNREKFIAEAIESVLAQTYQNWELIIVDDSSKDNTVAIAESYAQNNNRIRVYINEKNLGDYPNRNRAASYASGELLMYVDSDDTIQKDALEYVVYSFKINPTAHYATIYRNGDVMMPTSIEPKEVIENHFFKRSTLHFGPGGTVVKRTFFNQIGCFPEKYGPANDMYYNIKAASNTSVILMPYDYLNYRIHSGQESNNAYDYLFQGHNYFQDMLSLNELPLSRAQRDYLRRKSKKRFLVNWFKYLIKSRNLRKSLTLFYLAKFGCKDIIQGLFA
jgi:glycosyltransferase involved in cell wall biosynthesis